MAWELILFIAAISVVALGCLLPVGWLPILPYDKWLHFGSFTILTSLALPLATSWQQQLYWLGGLVLAGWLIEVLQKLVPGRNFCWRDMGANVAGIAAAAGIANVIRAF